MLGMNDNPMVKYNIVSNHVFQNVFDIHSFQNKKTRVKFFSPMQDITYILYRIV